MNNTPPPNRPQFSPRLPVEVFSVYYWYKEELAALCRQFGLAAGGTKAELQNRLKEFLRTGKIINKSPRSRFLQIRKSAEVAKPFTLSTRLIPDGFKFNHRARDFFARYFKVKKFSFTKEMATALRDAEKHGDLKMTVADLIAVYKKRQKQKNLPVRKNAEEKTYQWNNFVRDFSRDTRTCGMSNRLQIAALLWREVRGRAGAKTYAPQLLAEFAEAIAKISKRKEAFL